MGKKIIGSKNTGIIYLEVTVKLKSKSTSKDPSHTNIKNKEIKIILLDGLIFIFMSSNLLLNIIIIIEIINTVTIMTKEAKSF